MICQLGPRGASSDAGAQRTTRDKYDTSVGCSAAKGPGRLRDDRLFSSDDITILVHGKWGFATTGVAFNKGLSTKNARMRAAFGPRLGCPRNFAMRASRTFGGTLTFFPVASSHSTTWVASVPLAIPRPVLGAAGELAIFSRQKVPSISVTKAPGSAPSSDYT